MQFVFTGARFFYHRDDPEIVPGHEPIPEQVDVWEEYYKNMIGYDENCRECLFLSFLIPECPDSPYRPVIAKNGISGEVYFPARHER